MHIVHLHIVHIEPIYLHIAYIFPSPRDLPRDFHWNFHWDFIGQYISCIFFAYCAYYSAYLLTYFVYWTNDILCIFHIFVDIHFTYFMHIVHIFMFCILCILFDAGHILHILHILYTSHIAVSFVVYSHYCLVPHPWAQLFMYYHLHPLPLFWPLSQEAPRKSSDSLSMFKGILPFSPMGTTRRSPSVTVELTGMTYNTCACSLHS
jgi:hypothetical protein